MGSKYEEVKLMAQKIIPVRIWVDDYRYVLSRYVLCRALVGAKIDYNDAVKISLELKKTLVDLQLSDIVQLQFEDYLFQAMLMYGYTSEHIDRYHMLNRFHQNRIPLLIVLMGTGMIGKSTLATKVAARMNVTNVVQVDIVFDVLSCVTLETNPNTVANDSTLDVFKDQCKVVEKGIEYDIRKCIHDGKPTIVEGRYLDPVACRDLVARVQATVDQESYQGIIVPILLTLDRDDHETFALMSGAGGRDTVDSLQQIQSYLQSRATLCPDIQTVGHNIHSFDETSNKLHDIVLDKLQTQYNAESW